MAEPAGEQVTAGASVVLAAIKMRTCPGDSPGLWRPEPRLYHIQGGPKKPKNLFIKKLCIYFYMFQLQSSSKYSLFDAMEMFFDNLFRCFSIAQNSF